uniref:C2H2-type domain-containing protein n=1 Tax=Xiphophorus couchianus TaxID=32473 RepID=A0A3B5M593_9TELE
MDTSWSNFLFQTTPTQTQAEAPLQAELLPDLTGSAQSPPAEHIVTPPSTVDTAALSEEPLPVKPLPKPPRPAHICSTCNKEFKNSYNLRRHQSVHTGIKMKDRTARDKEDGAKAGRLEKTTIPLSLLQLTLPPQPLPPAGAPDAQPLSVSVAPATVTVASPPQPIQAAIVVVGSMEQVGQPVSKNPSPSPVPNPNQVRKNHACEACGKAFRDVYHLNRHRLSHSDEKPYSCPVCQQRFKRKDRMSYHVRSHQGGVEKPYICPHCSKNLSASDPPLRLSQTEPGSEPGPGAELLLAMEVYFYSHLHGNQSAAISRTSPGSAVLTHLCSIYQCLVLMKWTGLLLRTPSLPLLEQEKLRSEVLPSRAGPRNLWFGVNSPEAERAAIFDLQ